MRTLELMKTMDTQLELHSQTASNLITSHKLPMALRIIESLALAPVSSSANSMCTAKLVAPPLSTLSVGPSSDVTTLLVSGMTPSMLRPLVRALRAGRLQGSDDEESTLRWLKTECMHADVVRLDCASAEEASRVCEHLCQWGWGVEFERVVARAAKPATASSSDSSLSTLVRPACGHACYLRTRVCCWCGDQRPPAGEPGPVRAAHYCPLCKTLKAAPQHGQVQSFSSDALDALTSAATTTASVSAAGAFPALGAPRVRDLISKFEVVPQSIPHPAGKRVPPPLPASATVKTQATARGVPPPLPVSATVNTQAIARGVPLPLPASATRKPQKPQPQRVDPASNPKLFNALVSDEDYVDEPGSAIITRTFCGEIDACETRQVDDKWLMSLCVLRFFVLSHRHVPTRSG